MRTLHKAIITAAGMSVFGFLSATAAPGGIPGPPPWGGGPGGNPGAPGQNKGAPGPLAGAGLPFLVLAGGYALVRHYRGRRRAQSGIMTTEKHMR